jgi:long-chain acyl-CoA synthetase
VLHEEVLGRAERWSSAVALVDAATGRTLRYRELVDGVRRFAGELRARGARPGDVLGLVAFNALEFPIAMHGALGAGLTVAPASPLLTARELSAFLRQAGARYAVGDVESLEKVTGVEAVFALEALPMGTPLDLAGGDPEAPAVLFSTSGTTGLPKSAAHTHAGAVATLRQYAAGGFGASVPTTSCPGSCRSRTCTARSCSTRYCASVRAWSRLRASSPSRSCGCWRSTG